MINQIDNLEIWTKQDLVDMYKPQKPHVNDSKY